MPSSMMLRFFVDSFKNARQKQKIHCITMPFRMIRIMPINELYEADRISISNGEST